MGGARGISEATAGPIAARAADRDRRIDRAGAVESREPASETVPTPQDSAPERDLTSIRVAASAQGCANRRPGAAGERVLIRRRACAGRSRANGPRRRPVAAVCRAADGNLYRLFKKVASAA